jgi:sensor c-di-GMP phosphodiesterase-like protein
MNINDIKIDRTFVSALTSEQGSTHIVEAIISMAKSFGLTTIAEGVETKEQLDCLEKLGCTYAQGYYISKAMSIEEVFKFIKNWQVS